MVGDVLRVVRILESLFAKTMFEAHAFIVQSLRSLCS